MATSLGMLSWAAAAALPEEEAIGRLRVLEEQILSALERQGTREVALDVVTRPLEATESVEVLRALAEVRGNGEQALNPVSGLPGSEWADRELERRLDRVGGRPVTVRQRHRAGARDPGDGQDLPGVDVEGQSVDRVDGAKRAIQALRADNGALTHRLAEA